MDRGVDVDRVPIRLGCRYVRDDSVSATDRVERTRGTTRQLKHRSRRNSHQPRGPHTPRGPQLLMRHGAPGSYIRVARPLAYAGASRWPGWHALPPTFPRHAEAALRSNKPSLFLTSPLRERSSRLARGPHGVSCFLVAVSRLYAGPPRVATARRHALPVNTSPPSRGRALGSGHIPRARPPMSSWCHVVLYEQVNRVRV